jgi:hypothetical protein
MAQRALDPQRHELVVVVEEPRHADDGVAPQELDRDGGIVQVDVAVLDLVQEIR